MKMFVIRSDSSRIWIRCKVVRTRTTGYQYEEPRLGNRRGYRGRAGADAPWSSEEKKIWLRPHRIFSKGGARKFVALLAGIHKNTDYFRGEPQNFCVDLNMHRMQKIKKKQF